MKNISSILLLAGGILASTTIQAQELKTAVAKPIENTVPAPGSKVAATADITPVPKMKFEVRESSVQVAATVSPLTREEPSAPGSLNAEQLKTLNGTAQRPKQQEPIVDDKNAKGASEAKPVILKVPEKQ